MDAAYGYWKLIPKLDGIISVGVLPNRPEIVANYREFKYSSGILPKIVTYEELCQFINVAETAIIRDSLVFYFDNITFYTEKILDDMKTYDGEISDEFDIDDWNGPTIVPEPPEYRRISRSVVKFEKIAYLKIDENFRVLIQPCNVEECDDDIQRLRKFLGEFDPQNFGLQMKRRQNRGPEFSLKTGLWYINPYLVYSHLLRNFNIESNSLHSGEDLLPYSEIFIYANKFVAIIRF
jgi:hypothetical protein